ncbi:SUF system Fe-S cluster assembly regulator [Teichococcus oryzae]|uniref:SUF system Fe-S cluster assembly regulator n=1 Tax=Teichococcus oryzae TaxID=1608942 RepID=A0A5B2TK96_9PROT|nr:SUF system Fe-S cluster assembly regulator [Pseudoroseomonas oryzae]KAA2214435.1 SUF system Fe-S cluster assembly regulator [Pseudoroseomonas oryzae]
MLRLSKLTDYAVVVLARLALPDGEPPNAVSQTAPAIAAATGIAEPTVAKVLKALAHAGLVEGRRGSGGGYRLSRPLAAMTLPEVIAAIDGPVALTACVDGAAGQCEAETLCPVRGRWDRVNRAVLAALSDITLDELAMLPAPPARRTALPASPAHLPAE